MMHWHEMVRLRRSRAGAAGAEMALIAPVLAGLLFVGMDLGLAFWEKLQLEQAAQRSIELVVAPGTTGLDDFDHLDADVRAAYGKPVKSVSVQGWLECNGVRQGSWNTICPAGQRYARFVEVQVQAEYQPAFSFGGIISGSGTNGGFLLTGDALVRLQ